MATLRVRAVTDAEWGRTLSWKEEAPLLKRRAEQVLSGLKKVFDDDGDSAHHGIVFKEDGANASLALVKTPLSEGRLLFNFVDSENALLGRILVQRQQTDSTGQLTWQTVWHITFRDKGAVYAVDPAEQEAFDLDSISRERRENAFFALGMSINYALLAGPVYP